MLEKYLKQLEQELELESPFVSETAGSWNIPLDENFNVTLTALQPQGFSLNCVVGDLPESEEFLDQVMVSNLFGQGTEGAILAVDEFEKHLVLTRHFEEDVEYQRFKDILEDFINAADVWQSEVVEQQGQG